MRISLQQIRAELITVEEDHNFLRCLYEVGVDNWPGYEEAQKIYDLRYNNTEVTDEG